MQISAVSRVSSSTPKGTTRGTPVVTRGAPLRTPVRASFRGPRRFGKVPRRRVQKNLRVHVAHPEKTRKLAFGESEKVVVMDAFAREGTRVTCQPVCGEPGVGGRAGRFFIRKGTCVWQPRKPVVCWVRRHRQGHGHIQRCVGVCVVRIVRRARCRAPVDHTSVARVRVRFAVGYRPRGEIQIANGTRTRVRVLFWHPTASFVRSGRLESETVTLVEPRLTTPGTPVHMGGHS